jgi:hypothetical protein
MNWGYSTRLNYLLVMLGLVSLFLGFTFNLNKIFSIPYTSYFTSINISFPHILVILFAFVILIRANVYEVSLKIFLLLSSLTSIIVSSSNFAAYFNFFWVFCALSCWVYLANQILSSENVSKYNKVFFGLCLILYFLLDYLNFLLPIPILFCLVYWMWLKSTKPLNFVFYGLIGYMVLNLLISVYQVATSSFLGLNLLGENFQLLELARQNLNIFSFDHTFLRGYGLLPHPNNLSMLGIFCLSLTSIFNKNKLLKYLIYISFIIVILSFSRLGIALLEIYLIINFVWKNIKNWRKVPSKNVTAIIIFVVISIGTLTVLWLGRGKSDLVRVEEFSLWINLFSNLSYSPLLFGIGLGGSAFFLQKNFILDNWAYQPAHFGPFNLVLEIGIIPILLVILALYIRKLNINSEKKLNQDRNLENNLVWITSFGKFNSKERQGEVYSSIQKNLKANIFNKIYIFSEDSVELDNLNTYLSNQNEVKKYLSSVEFVNTKAQYTIQQSFNHIKTLVDEVSAICLSNSDISFSDNFNSLVHENLGKSEFWAITRYQDDALYDEGRLNKLLQLYSTSQDTWVASLQDWELIQKEFYLGRKSVDNLLAFNAFKIGLQVNNPALSVRTNHNHSLNLKEWNNKEEYHGFKLFLTPSRIGGISEKEIIWE